MARSELIIYIYTYIYTYAHIYIQGVSRGRVNIIGGGSMDYSEQISSYKHVSIFQWV